MDSAAPVRFLHIADIHLGCRQYHNRERQRDFYLALDSVVERFVLPLEEGGDPQVDFVLIPGDLFDHRNLPPITLSQASDVLARLKEAGIPVLTSEGNHDAMKRHESGEPNWYQYLCGERALIFLRDVVKGGQIVLEPWNEEDREGSYYDLPGGIRVIGTQWYGAQAHAMIEPLTAALEALSVQNPARFTILMFHGGLIDYVNALSAGLEYEQLLPLREYVQYLALGHVHKRYERQGWLFNPGSLEASKVGEFFEEHGAYRGTIYPDGRCEVEHLSDYRKRPFLWLELDCDLFQTPEALVEGLQALVEEQGQAQLQRLQDEWPDDVEFVAPICYIKFSGTLGFPFSKIPMATLKPWICETLGVWLVRTLNDTSARDVGGVEGLSSIEGRIDREALERQIFARLLHNDSRFADRAEPLASFASSLKQKLLDESLDAQEHAALVLHLGQILSSDDAETSALEELSREGESDRKNNENTEGVETLEKIA